MGIIFGQLNAVFRRFCAPSTISSSYTQGESFQKVICIDDQQGGCIVSRVPFARRIRMQHNSFRKNLYTILINFSVHS